MGGAAAIAAMTYGTETIPSVSKIFGAGNSYVTEAKMQVFGKVAIDMPAGPSEVFVIADQTANPAFIAADLLADAEHGPDSACVLVTTSQRIAEETARQIKIQIKTLATKEWIKKSLRKYGLLAVVMTLDEAIDFANGYAPEHLEIMTKNPEQIAMKIKNAGSVFLGPWTTKSAGDYATGANHVLPTGGMAKMFAPLSIESFGRKIEFQKVANKKALGRIAQSIEVFGRVEKLPAHANATSIRFKKL
jgi:histidinol dehydrogenase